MVGSINFVNVGGHLFTIMGDGRGQFQWTSDAENRCLDRHLRVGTRMTPHSTVEHGKMVAFAFESNYDSTISAFMLYLCARGKDITNQQLRNLLANHIEEHFDGFLDTYTRQDMHVGARHSTYREATNWFCKETTPVIGNRANFRIPGERLPYTFIQAFCDVFGYVCEVYTPSLPMHQGQYGTIQLHKTFRPNRLPGYPYDVRDLESPVRLLKVEPSNRSNQTYQLLGIVQSSYEVDVPIPAPVIDLR
jgi:hypothetical protein